MPSKTSQRPTSSRETLPYKVSRTFQNSLHQGTFKTKADSKYSRLSPQHPVPGTKGLGHLKCIQSYLEKPMGLICLLRQGLSRVTWTGLKLTV